MHVGIVGGGAAGMMAAIAAAQKGAEVTILEKGDKLGYKVLIAGNGACNLTNRHEANAPREFIRNYPGNGKFLLSAFFRLTPEATIHWFEHHGVALTVERGGRVFPTSRHSWEVVEALTREIRRLGVRVCLETPVSAIRKVKENFQVDLPGRTCSFDRLVVATGGKSFPGTGSTGDGFRFAEQLGHHLVAPVPALVPLRIPQVKELAGLALRNVRAFLRIEGREKASEQGEMLFTHTGVSGPIVLTLSREVALALRAQKEVQLGIDLKPALSVEQVEAGLLRDWQASPKQQLSNALKSRLPARLAPHILQAAKVSANRIAAEVSKEERRRLVAALKGWILPVEGTLPIETAIVTAGGVDTREIDPKTLESRVLPGLYWAGEVIDVDGVTGGYNLQAAWSTGWVAGESAAG